MRARICTVLFFIPFILFSQDPLRKRGLSIGLIASPDYSYRMLRPGSSSMDPAIIQSRNSDEIPKLSYTIGLLSIYQLTNSFSLSLGMEYSVKGEQTRDLALSTGASISPGQGFSYTGNSAESVKFVYNTVYIDLPLKLDYYLMKRRTALYISGGISPNIYLFEKVNSATTYSDGSVKKSSSMGQHPSDAYHGINPQGQFGFGIDLIKKSYRIRIEPVYRMSLMSVNKGSINGYFYSFGLNLICLFDFSS